MSDKETFGSKLEAMRLDLCSIVDRMNRDRSTDTANLAQQVLVALDALNNQLEQYGMDEFEWDWQPEEEQSRG